MRRFGCALSALLLFHVGILFAAEKPGETYIRVYHLIEQADKLEGTQPVAALEKYMQAQAALKVVQKDFPNWNNDVVEFRLQYLQRKIPPLMSHLKIPQPNNASPADPQPAGPSEILIVDLNQRIERMRAENNQLVAEMERQETEWREKLKEALAARPRALEPGELARVEEQNKALRGKIVYLESNFKKGTDGQDGLRTTLAETQRESETLRKQLAELSDEGQMRKLREENVLLRKRIVEMNRALISPVAQQGLQQQLDVVQKQLDEERQQAQRLKAENEKLRELLQKP